jgi:hypothetical protein
MNRWRNCGFLALGMTANLLAEETAATLPKIESDSVREASGLAISPKNEALLWTLNDSGGTTDLHLMGVKEKIAER